MQVYGTAVDDAISRDLWPTGEPVAVLPGVATQGDGLRGTREALEVIERHLEPLTNRQLGALALLRQEGGPWSELVEFYLTHSVRRGPVTGLLDALAALSLVRSFRGVSVLRGTAGGGARIR